MGRLLHDTHDDADTQVECPGGFGCGELPRAVAHVVREFVEAILEVVWLRLTSSLPASRYQQASYVWRWNVVSGTKDNRASTISSYDSRERITLVEGVLFLAYAFGR